VKKLLQALKRWMKFPKPHATETKCVVCGCTDSRGCPPDSCSWVHADVDGKFGVCSKCYDDRLCELGRLLIALRVEERGHWKPKKTCTCPLCEASRKRKA
jgi:hypothetical protein